MYLAVSGSDKDKADSEGQSMSEDGPFVTGQYQKESKH